ncbi:paired amphipathic helix protein Sin3-like 4 isoform X1 [Typha angustifolia]|uniref:paired amphipathic helix protein Sin3-like 4 isoform X1 n=3 Tax=Typha angustifolia TaxID=59011 RepID=UPI003C2F3709
MHTNAGTDCKGIRHALDYFFTVKRELLRDNINNYNKFLQIMVDFDKKRIDYREVTVRLRELFKDRPHLILGFENMGKREISSDNKSLEMKDALDLVNRIKDHFRNDQVSYSSFLKTLFLYISQKKTVDDVHQKVEFLLRDQHDLLKEFRRFLPANLAKMPLPHQSSGIISKSHDGRMAMPNHAQGDKVHRTCNMDADYNLKTGYLHLKDVRNESSASQNAKKDWGRRVHGSNELTIEHGKMDTDNELSKQRLIQRDESFMAEHLQKDTDFQIRTSIADDELVSELALSAYPQCSPSYRILPENYPVPLASNRTEADASVLNDVVISVASGREEDSDIIVKNKYEEILCKCDDDRYELDMLLEWLTATSERVEELLSTMKSESLVRVEEHLTSLNMRCIEGLYGEYGLEVVDILLNDATTALPVIHARLKQKKEELARYYSDLSTVWVNKFAQIYQRSLDSRSFYFKKQDVKMLSTKALLAEAKKFSEKKREEDDVLLHTVANNRQPKSSVMEFFYTDLAIHEDLYDIINYFCGEFCTSKEQLDMIMGIWTTIEPILGIFRPTKGPENNVALTINKRVFDNSRKSIHKNGNGTIREKFTAFDEIDPERSGGDNIQKQPKYSCKTRLALECKVNGSSIKLALLNHGYTAERNSKIYNYHGGSSVHNTFKIEREEPELSTSREENNPLVIEDALNKVPEITDYTSKHHRVRTGKLVHHGEPAGEGNVDDGIPGTLARISLNFPEVGGNDSGGVSGHSEDLSCEDHYNKVGNASQDVNTECENGAGKMAHTHVGGERMPSVSTDCCFDASRPLREHKSKFLHDNEDQCCRVFYGNSSFYVLFRLHQILYERLLFAKKSTSSAHIKHGTSKETSSPDYLYDKFKLSLYNLLNGSADNLRFEDACLSLLGNQSYVLFTLDKLIYRVIQQLQEIASNDKDNKLLQLHVYENSRGPGVFSDLFYYENARTLVHDESMFRFQCSLDPTRLSIELMESGNEECKEVAASLQPEFSAYLHNDFLSNCSEKEMHNIFLRRNKRKLETVYGISDTRSSMEGVRISNGLKYRMNSSYKVTFLHDTEDLFIHTRKKRRQRYGDQKQPSEFLFASHRRFINPDGKEEDAPVC